MKQTVFDDTGQSRWIVDSSTVQTAAAGWTVVEGSYDDTYYLSGGVPTLKSTSPAVADVTTVVADGVAAVTITGIPNPSQLEIRGAAYSAPVTITDGEAVLTFDMVGTYTVLITGEPPYLDKNIEVVAT